MTSQEELNVQAAPAAHAPQETTRSLGRYAAIRVIGDASGTASVVVTGELDVANADALTAALREAVAASAAGLLLDLSEVAFCDCRALRSLLIARASAHALGRDVAIGPHSRAVARLLELTGTRSLLTPPR